jgi:hypothetical protein
MGGMGVRCSCPWARARARVGAHAHAHACYSCGFVRPQVDFTHPIDLKLSAFLQSTASVESLLRGGAMRLSQLPPSSAHLLRVSKGESSPSAAEVVTESAGDPAAHAHSGTERFRASPPALAAHDASAAELGPAGFAPTRLRDEDAHHRAGASRDLRHRSPSPSPSPSLASSHASVEIHPAEAEDSVRMRHPSPSPLLSSHSPLPVLACREILSSAPARTASPSERHRASPVVTPAPHVPPDVFARTPSAEAHSVRPKAMRAAPLSHMLALALRVVALAAVVRVPASDVCGDALRMLSHR